MTDVIFVLFGLIVGSFLNVVILRFGERGIGGRSACPSCGTILRWYDLIPVLSWVSLGGRCRYCRARISAQYPLVEAGTGLLFGLVGGAGLGPAPLLLALLIAALLTCIFVYDLYHQLIPDAWVWPLVALAFFFGYVALPPGTGPLTPVLAGPIAALPILFLWYLSRPFTGNTGMWMGFGDVKLALGIGWLLPFQTELGFPIGLMAICFAFVIGAVVSVGILLPLPRIMRFWGLRNGGGTQGYTMKSEVPFGPFLIASCLVVWFSMMYHLSIPFVI